MSVPVLLFAGPSLSDPGAALPPNILLRPPARCGDLLRGAQERPAAIGLVDGLFETGPTVWHKEIMAVLDRGIAVYGAASLGALRAAELDRFGMVGVGGIYEDYRDGRIERDDAVMVSHAPAALGYRAITLSLVDAEASIEAASGLRGGERRLLLAAARGLGFRERDWPKILTRITPELGSGRAAELAAAIADAGSSRKAQDAATLIGLLGSLSAPVAPKRPGTPPTLFLARLHARTREDPPG